jgi:tetratricopeptide repeat protein/cytochrome c554/c'-like protein
MRRKFSLALRGALVFEVANAAYLAAFDSATILYHVQVVAHLAVGLLLALLLILVGGPEFVRGFHRPGPLSGRACLIVLAVAGAIALGTAVRLAQVGTATPYRRILVIHVGASVVALFAAAGWSLLCGGRARGRRALSLLACALAFPLAVRGSAWLDPQRPARIENPPAAPLSFFYEGGGGGGLFYPSSATTVGGRYVPEDFFLESRACGNRGCHPDITRQWDSSMHHFSSFNNQWYRKSVEYMQEVVGTRPSKWCGGCHDPAVLLTGRMDERIAKQIETPQAQAGIGCLVCHSIVHVPDTMGQGGYVLEYPEMHRLVASRSPLLHKLHDYMVRLDPGPHKATMLKPFHRESRAEFCSACHKVHLDRPVNNHRWIRGFDEYDAWQGSGVSGQGARAFYYPDKPKDCGDCHMPLVRSADAANRDGFVHSHRFAAANTAVPFANQDEEQLAAARGFLSAGILSLDIFAATEAGAAGAARAGAANSAAAEPAEPRASTMLPDLPDAGLAGPPAAAGSVRAGGATPVVVAPLDRAAPFLRPGRAYRIDVVARTRGVGHSFPGGTVDAFDVWLELKAEDAEGRVFYWSGYVEDGGRGPVEAGAHRYRSLLVDGSGNPINKRNAWAARAVVYARLIPPGAADVGRFRVVIPEDARGPLIFRARMNYRKFAWWNTQFSYAGVRDPAVKLFVLTPNVDNGRFLFTGDTAQVSGRIKSIPDLPTTVVAESRLSVDLAPPSARRVGAGAAIPRDVVPVPQPLDRERFNDYGIGLLLQGDLAAAAAAFRRVNEVDPRYAAGFVNLGRVLVQEGDDAGAIAVLEHALEVDPQLAAGHYFLALALKARGRYDETLDHLRAASAKYPRDKVVLDQIGRLLLLKRRPREAIAEFDNVLRVDPEDVAAHYNLMLCYRALGDALEEKRQEVLYARFKADEAAQGLAGDYVRLHPEDNIERQPIHEHVNRFEVPGKAAR